MTDVTRIACPGCRSSLRFEPEALDFPAYCATCECRFSAGIYVRVACPNCHNGSRIRESYRGQQVRCNRCRHEFVADEGIRPGGGGLLLVARMLDTDLPEPPETVQPFLGHARPDPATLPDPIPNDDDRAREAERLQARAIAERDRLAEEAGLLKAILARLVATPAPTVAPDGAPTPTTEGPARPVDAEQVARLEAELARVRSEADGDRARLGGELDAARGAVDSAEGRAKAAEDALARAIGEHGEAGREAARRSDDHGLALREADRERATLSAAVDRLNQAVLSARSGEAEALRRLEDAAGRLDESRAAVEAGRERANELARLVESLRTEVKAGAARADALSAGLEAERAGRERNFEEERRGLSERMARLEAEAEARLAASAEAAERAGQALGSAEARHRAELDDRAALLAEAGRARQVLVDRVGALTVERDRARSEAEGPIAENRRLADAVDRLLEENMELTGSTERLIAENRRMTADLSAAREAARAPAAETGEAEALRSEKARVEGELEAARTEAARRQAGLVAEIRRIQAEYQKLVDVNKGLDDQVRRPIEERPPSRGPSIPAVEGETHRDLAMTLLYGDRPGDGRDAPRE